LITAVTHKYCSDCVLVNYNKCNVKRHKASDLVAGQTSDLTIGLTVGQTAELTSDLTIGLTVEQTAELTSDLAAKQTYDLLPIIVQPLTDTELDISQYFN
jgi:hypothetical protein